MILASSTPLPQYPSAALLLLWPSVVAAGLAVFALERARTRRGVPPTPRRLLASFVLLIPALVLGTVWVLPWLTGPYAKFSPQANLASTYYGAAVALVSAFYVWRSLRLAREHAQRAPERAARFHAEGRLVASAIVFLCATGLTSLFLAAIA